MPRMKIGVLCFATLVLAALSGCSGGSHQPQIQNVTVTVSAPTSTVSVFGTLQFTAMVTGSSNTNVTWEVGGVAGGSQAAGFISSSGLFVAPSSAPSKSDGTPIPVMITAVSQANTADSGSMSIMVLARPNQSAQNGAVKLGTSGGNQTDITGNKCCSGTLGALVVRNGTQYVLSNNHVLAKSDFGTAGDAITQPGLADVNPTCTGPAATVANLTEFYNLQTGPLPKIDAAIAQVVNGEVDSSGNILLLGATATNGVPDPGPPVAGAGVAATVGMNVAKSGRTTGLTCSSVIGLNVSSTVSYSQNCVGTGTNFMVNFTDLVQVQGGTFSEAGDSGSLIVQQGTAQPVALLFGGNDQDTVGNPISDVLNFFTANAGNAVTTVVGGAAHQVIGCTLPTKPAAVVQTQEVSSLGADTVQKAAAARDTHAGEMMAHPEVQAIGLGASYDHPGEAAVVLFVAKGQTSTPLPREVDGVRTRIVEGALVSRRGALTADESEELEHGMAAPEMVYAIPESEVTRARAVKAAHVDEWMKKAGVQAVGITSSVDAPGEAALLIYLIRGAQQPAIPAVIDGLRTRVREGSQFKAGLGGVQPGSCKVPKVATKAAATVAAQK